jgi:phenylalanyl-tRNA synthetase beta chain
VLNENILVISDKNKAIAIAGIMGDKLSEVDLSTKDVLLESAYFDPVLIRRGSRQLGLVSEASYRFERQVDLDRVKIAQDRAIELICQIAKGKFIDEREDGYRQKQKLQQVRFGCSKAARILAMPVDRQQRYSLPEFLVKALKGRVKSYCPGFATGYQIEDLIEEFARINRYTQVPRRCLRSVLLIGNSLRPYIRSGHTLYFWFCCDNYNLVVKIIDCRTCVRT